MGWRGPAALLLSFFMLVSMTSSSIGIRIRPRGRHALSEDILPPVSGDQLRVAILNGVGFHTEVYCALLWSFQSAKADTSAFVDRQTTAGVEAVIASWYRSPLQAYEDFQGQACAFDMVVFATFPEHHLALAEQVAQQECPGQRMVGVVHNSQELHISGVKAFIQTVGIDVLALAPHTVDECKRVLQHVRVEASVQLFVPVFPITTGAPTCNGSLCWVSGNATQKSFVLQGLFESHRRNYHGLFDSILHHEGLMRDEEFVLRLIGRGDVAIPHGLHGKIVKEPDLPYPEYYRTVQEALAVLPAFASDVYYKSKASSSIATAITCGTPLVADQELLKAYSYLSKEATFVKGPDDDNAAGMARILKMPAEELLIRREAVDKLRSKLFIQNGVVVDSLLHGLHGNRSAESGVAKAVMEK